MPNCNGEKETWFRTLASSSGLGRELEKDNYEWDLAVWVNEKIREALEVQG